MKPTNEIIVGLVKHIGEQVKETDQLIPMFFMGGNDKYDVFMAPFREDEEKDMVAKFIKSKVVADKPDFVLFVSEAYVLRCESQKEWEKELAKYGSVSACPSAQEIVNFVLETPNRCWSAQADILPDRNISAVKWEEFTAEGRFANFFGADKPVIQ